MTREEDATFKDWDVQKIGTATRLTVTHQLSTGIVFATSIEIPEVIRLVAVKNARAREKLEREVRARLTIDSRAFAAFIAGGDT